MTQSKLSYDFEESPKWRDVELTTSEMIVQIVGWRNQYNELPQNAKNFCCQQFARAMAIDYIHNLNMGEMVGTQSQEDTEELLKKCFNDSSEMLGQPDRKRSEKETVNTYKSMKLLQEKAEEMDMSGLLTVQQICDVHGVLLKDVHPDCGKIRSKEAYTHWHDGPHFYPKPEQAACLFYSLIDHHNMNMSNKPSNDDPVQLTTYIFKCAARLQFDFVNTHPFSDGNGRMCRLLANYVVGVITPFPVSVYHTRNPAQSGRDDYLNAIVRCRENPAEGPCELASMLVEGAWQGWRNLFKNLERRSQLISGITIGPIVVQKSICNDEYVSSRVNNILPYVETGSIQAINLKEKVVEAIQKLITETDVSNLSCCQYIQKSVYIHTVESSNSVCVMLDIYN